MRGLLWTGSDKLSNRGQKKRPKDNLKTLMIWSLESDIYDKPKWMEDGIKLRRYYQTVKLTRDEASSWADELQGVLPK
jgi:hypothetical protein